MAPSLPPLLATAALFLTVAAIVLTLRLKSVGVPSRFAARAARHSCASRKASLPQEWSWQEITKKHTDMYRDAFGVEIATGNYVSPVFDQHASSWCGCCYLVAVVQMLQDRMHLVLGMTNPSMSMFPCFRFDMQCALDTYNAYEKRLRNDGWNACTGGMPRRVLEAIRNGQCELRLLPDGVWWGHPLPAVDEPRSGATHRNLPLNDLELLEVAAESIMRRVWKYGPVILGIDSRCLRDPNLSQNGGLIDTTIVSPRDHAVTVVGWKKVGSVVCWIVRNSWGEKTRPVERPDASCVGDDFNHCKVSVTDWTGDPSNRGYAYVPINYRGIKKTPSPWYDAIPSVLQTLLPRHADERLDLVDLETPRP